MPTQRNFASGEVAPALRARSDFDRYASGLAKCLNMYPRRHGGVISRPGTKYVAESRYTDKAVRLIPWYYSEDQTYVVELGVGYIRLVNATKQDYVFTATQAITVVTAANPGVITIAGHLLATDDVIKIEDVYGTTELNDRYFRVVWIDVDTFSLKTMAGTAVVTSAYGAYISGGTVKEPISLSAANGTMAVAYTIPYAEDELDDVTFTQSADVMTLCHSGYAPRDLVRTSGTAWEFVTKPYGAGIGATATPVAEDLPTTAARVQYAWKTTAVNAQGSESVGSTQVHGAQIILDDDALVTSKVPVQIGTSGTYLFDNGAAGGTDYFDGALVPGGGASFSKSYGVHVIITSDSAHDWSAIPITILGTSHDGSKGSEEITGPYAHGRVSFLTPFKAITGFRLEGTVAVGTLKVGVESGIIPPINITIGSATTGADRYRLYRAAVYAAYTPYTSTVYAYGYVAESLTRLGLIDEGGIPDYTRRPPTEHSIFDAGGTGSNEHPRAVGYFQQRLVFAGSNLSPESVWMTRTGLYYVSDQAGTPKYYANFNVTSPIQDDNAVEFILAGQQVNRVRHVLDLGRLFLFTELGEFIVEGNSSGVITPTQINPRKLSYNGIGKLRPIAIGDTALFLTRNLKAVLDLAYDQQATGYKGNDLSVFSSHFFDGRTAEDWTYQQDPDSLLWIVRDDGTMLSLTYLKEHGIYGWAQHNTPGTSAGFVSVCAIPNGAGRDDVYVAVKRTINGVVFRSIEVMSDRYDTTDSHLVQSDATVIIDNSATDANLKGWWKFDETQADGNIRATDSSGNDFHGSVATGRYPLPVTGKIDGARETGRPGGAAAGWPLCRYFDLDGYNSPLTNNVGPLSFDPCTWEGWVYIKSGATGAELFVGNHYNFQATDAWTFNFDTSGGAYKLSISLTFDNAPTYTVETLKDTAYNTAAETWTHIGFTWDGTWFRIYVDGVNVNSSNANAANSMWFTSAWGYHPCLGGKKGGVGQDGQYFDGYLDNWRAHNVARAPSWFRSAAAKIDGLWHLEGESVSVLGDGNIIASPNNSAYDTVTVANGSITLPSAYDYTTVGLPVVNDLETLRIDPATAPLHDTRRLVSGVSLHLDRSSRCWVGNDEPSVATALTDLSEMRMNEGPGETAQVDGAVTLDSGIEDVSILSNWDKDGKVFIRNVDPVPLSVLAITPHIVISTPDDERGR